jgi:hypothetical protein
MATTYKVLGQSIPSAHTNTTLYTCATANGAVCSTLSICNQGTSTNIRAAVRVANAAIEAKQYVVFDTIVNANDTMFLTIGTAIANTDVITVYAGTANVSFNLFGSEIT